MPAELDINLSPERIDEGTPEERATFGLLTIKTPHTSLTEGFDFYLNGNRQGPLVSGYYAAEWYTWNWWRLLCEPRSAASDWLLAHSMTSIGEGFTWPNIKIFSDGLRTALISSPSSRPNAKPFRYIGGTWSVVPSSVFEEALDAFVPQMIGRLRESNIAETNLDRLWRDVLTERSNPDIANQRRLEALLGRDPDAIADTAIERLLDDARTLGESAIAEVAANRGQFRDNVGILSTDDFRRLANQDGFTAARYDFLHLPYGVELPQSNSNVPAWQIGAAAARIVRKEQRLGFEPLNNQQLADLAGTSENVISNTTAHEAPISFALDLGTNGTRIVLRSKWITGRRFDLARLVGDRLIDSTGALHPATRAYTYRQKAQRSFAAELLSPFEVVDDLMAGDYSQERQQEIAERFDVSEMTVNSLLKNNGRLPREAFEDYVIAG